MHKQAPTTLNPNPKIPNPDPKSYKYAQAYTFRPMNDILRVSLHVHMSWKLVSYPATNMFKFNQHEHDCQDLLKQCA